MSKKLILALVLTVCAISLFAQTKKEEDYQDFRDCPSYDWHTTAGNSWVTHSSSITSGNYKVYRLSVAQGHTYTFKTGCGDGATANFDTVLHIYDASCVEVAVNDDGCESALSIITWIATYTGYAYVKVRGYSTGAGTYTMAYQRTDELRWQGTISTLWTNPSNWDGNVVPDNTFDVIIPNTATRPYLTGSSLVTGYCKSLTIESGGQLYIGNGYLNVTNDVLIQGTLNYYSSTTLDPTIALGGNWQKTGTFNHNNNGRVIFNGAGHQYVYSNENFSTLVVNNGAALRVTSPSHIVTCNVYDWQAGGIDVVAGTFTAHDLAQNGLYGGFWLAGEYSTINLTNSGTGTYVDLHGSVYNYGGTLNLTGTFADFPYANGANFTMTGGVLDIKTCTLRIMSGYTWTNSITGGTIRMAQGFTSQRADFTPAAGTFEFYGNTDWQINQTSGSTLHNVVINKAAATREEENSEPSGPIYDERSGMLLSDGTRANTISLSSDLTSTGNLEIVAGSTFNINAYTCNIGGSVTVYGNLTFSAAGSPTMNVDDSILWMEGATAN